MSLHSHVPTISSMVKEENPPPPYSFKPNGIDIPQIPAKTSSWFAFSQPKHGLYLIAIILIVLAFLILLGAVVAIIMVFLGKNYLFSCSN